MTARYHVLISDDLMAENPAWPQGLRPIEQEPTDPGRYPGMHWWLFEDDEVGPGFDGKRVELTISADYDEQGNITATRLHRRMVLP